MFNRRCGRRPFAKNHVAPGISRFGTIMLIEAMESRTLLSAVEAASAQLHLLSTTGTASKPIYNYEITLTNKGTTNIGTFWFAWVPGEDFLPAVPLSESNPSGWGSSVTGSGNLSDGSAILWVAGSTGAALAAGKSLDGFDFSSADSPAVLAGHSLAYPTTLALTSTIYIGTPESDPGFQFVVSPIPTMTKAASTTHLTVSAATITFGASVSFTAKVAPATVGGATPTGTITFKDGLTTLGTATVKSDGTAVLTTSSLAVGTHSIKAVYGGNSVYLGSSSTTLTETVKEPAVFNAVVTSDLAAINVELLKFKSDLITSTNKLVTDAAPIKADDAKQATAIAPLITKLDSDVKSIQAALQADHLTNSALIVADEAAVVAAEIKVIQDKSNATLEAAAKTTLRKNRIKLQADLLAALGARISVRQTENNTIAADAKNLLTTIGSVSHASAALEAAVTKFTSDKTSCATTLSADLGKLGTERTKLTADLTAEQTS